MEQFPHHFQPMTSFCCCCCWCCCFARPWLSIVCYYRFNAVLRSRQSFRSPFSVSSSFKLALTKPCLPSSFNFTLAPSRALCAFIDPIQLYASLLAERCVPLLILLSFTLGLSRALCAVIDPFFRITILFSLKLVPRRALYAIISLLQLYACPWQSIVYYYSVWFDAGHR